MTQKDDSMAHDVSEIKKVLTDFIVTQKKFNEEQKKFNVNIDKKIDRVQYFLEESMAQNAKLFFEEQVEMKVSIKEMEDEIFDLKNYVVDLASQIKILSAR